MIRLLILSFRYFKKMVHVFSSLLSIHTTYVHLPEPQNPVPPEIFNNPNLFLFFKDALSAIHGSHITIALPTAQ